MAEGTHNRAYERMGAHMIERGGRSGVEFAVWAPNAERVSVVGDFNGWNPDTHSMHVRPEAGVWETFVPDIGQGACYKYRACNRVTGDSSPTKRIPTVSRRRFARRLLLVCGISMATPGTTMPG